MQAYKVKGLIDQSGQLIITEPITIPPGEVELIVLQSVTTETSPAVLIESQAETTQGKFKSKVKAFQGLFENAPPTLPDFDPDAAKWEYLKEKHNL